MFTRIRAVSPRPLEVMGDAEYHDLCHSITQMSHELSVLDLFETAIRSGASSEVMISAVNADGSLTALLGQDPLVLSLEELHEELSENKEEAKKVFWTKRRKLMVASAVSAVASFAAIAAILTRMKSKAKGLDIPKPMVLDTASQPLRPISPTPPAPVKPASPPPSVTPAATVDHAKIERERRLKESKQKMVELTARHEKRIADHRRGQLNRATSKIRSALAQEYQELCHLQGEAESVLLHFKSTAKELGGKAHPTNDTQHHFESRGYKQYAERKANGFNMPHSADEISNMGPETLVAYSGNAVTRIGDLMKRVEEICSDPTHVRTIGGWVNEEALDFFLKMRTKGQDLVHKFKEMDDKLSEHHRFVKEVNSGDHDPHVGE